MKAQYEHEIVSSFLLFLDHELCSRGKAYTNYASYLYPAEKNYLQDAETSYYTYASPFKQFVFDQSLVFQQGDGKIRAPQIPSGVYLGENFVLPGQEGLSSIDHNMGQVHFSLDYPTTYGVLPYMEYAVKDFNIYLTNEPENKLLFETQYKINPKVFQAPTGLPSAARTYPAIYIKNLNSYNEGVGFDCYNTCSYIRAIVLADSAYALDASCALMKDMGRRYVHIIPAENQPFGPMGWIGHDLGDPANWPKGSEVFNYTGALRSHSTNHIEIDDVIVSKKSQTRQEFERLNTEIYVGFVDFTFKDLRYY